MNCLFSITRNDTPLKYSLRSIKQQISEFVLYMAYIQNQEGKTHEHIFLNNITLNPEISVLHIFN